MSEQAENPGTHTHARNTTDEQLGESTPTPLRLCAFTDTEAALDRCSHTATAPRVRRSAASWRWLGEEGGARDRGCPRGDLAQRRCDRTLKARAATRNNRDALALPPCVYASRSCVRALCGPSRRVRGGSLLLPVGARVSCTCRLAAARRTHVRQTEGDVPQPGPRTDHWCPSGPGRHTAGTPAPPSRRQTTVEADDITDATHLTHRERAAHSVCHCSHQRAGRLLRASAAVGPIAAASSTSPPPPPWTPASPLCSTPSSSMCSSSYAATYCGSWVRKRAVERVCQARVTYESVPG